MFEYNFGIQDRMTMIKEPERKETFYPKVQIIWLIDPEKIGGKKFFDLSPAAMKKVSGRESKPWYVTFSGGRKKS